MSEYICPRCKNPVYDDEAILCLFCGESLNRPGKHFPKSKIVFAAILLLLIISFIVLIIK